MIVELIDVAFVSRLRPFERRVLRHLMDSGTWVSRDSLIDAMYGHREDGGPLCADNTLSVHIHRIRKALQPGFYIAVAWGHGYRIEATEEALVGTLLSQVSEKLAA